MTAHSYIRACLHCPTTFEPRRNSGGGLQTYCSMSCVKAAQRAIPDAGRFWPKVYKAGANGCWLWTGALQRHGYGHFRDQQRVDQSAHRWSWEQANGRKVPNGLHVCHTCDVRNCVNPAHLFLGTIKDNAQDKVAKGRHTTKLNAAQVREIRRRADAGEMNTVLAREFNMSTAQIGVIVRRIQWKHVQ